MFNSYGINRVRDLLVVLSLLAVSLLPQSARAATLTFTNMRADMSTAIDPRSGNRIVSLLVNSTLFGPGGFAGGQFVDDAGIAPPDDNFWLADPFGATPPDDGMPAISFIIDSIGRVAGIDPTPFRLFIATPNGAGPLVIGELDFSGVTGSLGSLNLAGLVIDVVDAEGNRTGETYAVNPFTIEAVPLPAALSLFASGLGVMGLLGWRRRRKMAKAVAAQAQ
jgi:PEP-CTERM motif